MESVIKLPLLKPTAYSHTHTRSCKHRCLKEIMSANLHTPKPYSLACSSTSFLLFIFLSYMLHCECSHHDQVMTDCARNCVFSFSGNIFPVGVSSVVDVLAFFCVCFSNTVKFWSISYQEKIIAPTCFLAGTDIKYTKKLKSKTKTLIQRDEEERGEQTSIEVLFKCWLWERILLRVAHRLRIHPYLVKNISKSELFRKKT